MDKGLTIWLTGLSGAGKTTIAHQLAAEIGKRGDRVEVLECDELRARLSSTPEISRADRDAHIRRIAYVADLLTRQRTTTIVAATSPYRATRDEARRQIGPFVEVYVQCPLDELIRRDTRGVYARALSGEIEHFSGISDPYEEPLSPEVIVNTDRQGPTQSVAAILDYLELAGYLTRSNALSAPRRGRHVNRLIRGTGPLTIGRAYARSRRAA